MFHSSDVPHPPCHAKKLKDMRLLEVFVGSQQTHKKLNYVRRLEVFAVSSHSLLGKKLNYVRLLEVFVGSQCS